MSELKTVEKQDHHEKLELCTTRPRYRQGRRLTAVKVFAVSDESQHLLIHGVPAIAVTSELERLCLRFGPMEKFHVLSNYPSEKFTEVYYAKFQKIASARSAKQQLDDRSFYGGILHVCYAPELEDVEETRDKLLHRQREVNMKLNAAKSLNNTSSSFMEKSSCTETFLTPLFDISGKVPLVQPIKVVQSVQPIRIVPLDSPKMNSKSVSVKRIVYHKTNNKQLVKKAKMQT